MRCHITLTSSDHILRSCSISIPGDTGRTQSPSHQKMNSQLTHLTCEWYEKVLFKTFSRWLAFYCHLSRPVSPGSACFQINRIQRITLIFCPFCPNKSLIWCASLSLLYPLSFSNLPWPMTIKKLLLPGFILISEFRVLSSSWTGVLKNSRKFLPYLILEFFRTAWNMLLHIWYFYNFKWLEILLWFLRRLLMLY